VKAHWDYGWAKELLKPFFCYGILGKVYEKGQEIVMGYVSYPNPFLGYWKANIFS
jgi:hypothetical protein